MRINRDNYESFLVDYSEGVLSADLKQEVENFLLLNPDIKEELETFTGDSMQSAQVNFPDKENLKKIPFSKTSTSSDYFQQLCVAKIEGLLPLSEREFLEKLVRDDPEKKKELVAFEHTKLMMEQVVFNEKILLKQPDGLHNVDEGNFEEYCVACMEGWLDQAGLVELNHYIARNPEQKRVLDLYYKTRLTPDLTIVYPYKSKIKRFRVLSPTFKKYISIASSVAAALVLGLMVYYTSTIDDKSMLSGNMLATLKEKTGDTKASRDIVNPDTRDSVGDKMESSVLHDPFGFEKISGKEVKASKEKTKMERISIDPIQPIRFAQIECPPCRQANNNKALATLSFEKSNLMTEPDRGSYTSNSRQEVGEGNPGWAIAQAGISGFNKLTNSELVVEKNKERDKTRIAFNSKYFSFSTQVNNKN